LYEVILSVLENHNKVIPLDQFSTDLAHFEGGFYIFHQYVNLNNKALFFTSNEPGM
jgi:hypothetical protein